MRQTHVSIFDITSDVAITASPNIHRRVWLLESTFHAVFSPIEPNWLVVYGYVLYFRNVTALIRISPNGGRILSAKQARQYPDDTRQHVYEHNVILTLLTNVILSASSRVAQRWNMSLSIDDEARSHWSNPPLTTRCLSPETRYLHSSSERKLKRWLCFVQELKNFSSCQADLYLCW